MEGKHESRETLKLRFSVEPTLTVPQLATLKGFTIASNFDQRTLLVKSEHQQWKFEEDELRTCQTVIEQTVSHQIGGKISSLASSRYSAQHSIAVATKLGYEMQNPEESVRRAVQHIIALRQQPTKPIPEVKYSVAVNEDDPIIGEFVCKNLTYNKIAVLEDIYPRGEKDGNDFRVQEKGQTSYDLENMEAAANAIIQAQYNQKPDACADEIAVADVTSDMPLLDQLLKLKDFNGLKNAAQKDHKLEDLYNEVLKVSTALNNTRLRMFSKKMPVGTLKVQRYIEKLSEVVRKDYPEFDNPGRAAIINVFLRHSQVVYNKTAGTITKIQ